MTCPKCQTVNAAGAQYCDNCGFELLGQAPASKSETEPLKYPARIICVRCNYGSPATLQYCTYCTQLLPLQPGATLNAGRYVIERVLGQGGMGRAYLATDTRTSQSVVVKELLDEQGRPQNEQRMYIDHFENEANVLAKLRVIRFVPRLIQASTVDGNRRFFVMEYIDGVDLGELVRENNNRPIPVETAVEYGLQICDVLRILHFDQPPIVHRDIKPDNLRLRRSDETVALLDFGIARDVRTGTSLTKLGGSAGYAPPEFVKGMAEPRSDLYSLSATLFYLLTAHLPEDGPQDVPGSYRMPGAMRRYNPLVSPDLEEVILTNLAPEPADRYTSVKEFAADLRANKVTQDIVCPNCQRPNDRRRVYCTYCAMPLKAQSRQCPNCRHFAPINARFCPICGTKFS